LVGATGGRSAAGTRPGVPLASRMARLGPVARAVVTFVLLGAVVLLCVGVAGVLVLRRLATAQALDQAREFTAFSARVVERRLDEGLLSGDPGSIGNVDAAVTGVVLQPPVVRVKIWTADGEIVYSDEPRLIGETYHLDDDERAALASDGVTSDVSDLAAPENRFERRAGPLLEVYTAIQTPSGTPLLFETYQRSASVTSSGRELLGTFAPVLLVTLVAFAALLVPLAWALARRLQRAQLDRERFLQRAVEASDVERSRIARDLHDGAVQDLVGLSMGLAAAAKRTDDTEVAAELSDAAAATRASIRTLRSAVIGVYPANVSQAGLEGALSDLGARLQHEGIDITVSVDAEPPLPNGVAELMYRACQEALRNVAAHADATHVTVTVARRNGTALLDVVDDGRGFSPEAAARARGGGHLGIQILGDLFTSSGGSLEVHSTPGSGVEIHGEVPV
jgi:two-component system, NarL family, sensor kinase